MARGLIWVVASAVTTGRCRYCNDRVLWAPRALKTGGAAGALPFNRPRPVAIKAQRHDETGLVLEAWPTAALHGRTCRSRPAAARW